MEIKPSNFLDADTQGVLKDLLAFTSNPSFPIMNVHTLKTPTLKETGITSCGLSGSCGLGLRLENAQS